MLPTTMSPAISAIIVAPFGLTHVRQLLRVLARQTIRDRLEVVIMIPSRADVDAAGEEALAAFAAHQVIETGPMSSLPRWRAEGVHAASAPVVVLTEDHCFPDPGWAEALVRAHEGPWAAVGPVFEPPDSPHPLARASCLMQYAPWTHPARAGEVDDLPGHNSSYKRDLLLAYGERLATMLAAESVLHWDLRRRGHRLWLENGARVRHVYMTKLRGSLTENLYIGRGFAASRARGWSLPHRAAFSLASPLVPVVRLARLVPRAIALGWGRELPRILPALLPQLAVSAAGEFIGCTFGIGNAVAMGVDLDTRRYRFVSAEARAAIWGATDDPPGAAPAPRS